MPSQLLAAIIAARDRGRMERDTAARELRARMYADLSQELPGKLEKILYRGEAQVMRLALIFALLDQSSGIACTHLQAALFLWRYGEASATHILAENLLSPKATKTLDAIKGGPMTKSQVHELFGRNATKAEIESALANSPPES